MIFYFNDGPLYFPVQSHQRILRVSIRTFKYADARTCELGSFTHTTGISLILYPKCFASASVSTSNPQPFIFERRKTRSAASAVNALNPHCVSQRPGKRKNWMMRFPTFPGSWRYHGWGGSSLLSLCAREQITTSYPFSNQGTIL